MLKLSELKALRSKMERTPWDRTTPHAISNEEYDLGRFDGPADAAGVVACVNAVDVLIDISELARLLRSADCAHVYCSAEKHGTACPVRWASDQLDAALAKVSP